MDGFCLDQVHSNVGRVCVKEGRINIRTGHAVPMKVRGPFLRIRKKVGPTISLNVGKQSALTIVEEEAPTPVQKKARPRNGRKKVLSYRA